MDIKIERKNTLAVLGILLIDTRLHMLIAVIVSIGFKNNRTCLIQLIYAEHLHVVHLEFSEPRNVGYNEVLLLICDVHEF